MPITFPNTKAFGVRPIVDLSEPTVDQLKAEAAALGDKFTAVTCHPADLVADGEEMLTAEEDLPDLIEREYEVSKGLIKRIELLMDMMAPHMAEEKRAAAWSHTQIEASEQARKKLIRQRGELARIARAAGLPPQLFSLETSKTERLNVVMMKVEEVLHNVAAVRSLLPDKKRVDQLVVEVRTLLDEQRDMRAEARVSAVTSRARIRERQRLERLLYEALMYLSSQGLAAYPNDPTRDARYRLDHVYGKKPSKVGDPGAGGVEGDPNAPGPDDI